jgi:sec-independent protein translocase protein TatA
MQGLEWIILLVVIVVVFAFGGKKIPELARSLGRAKGEFERGKRDIQKEIAEEDDKNTKTEEKDVVKAAQNLGIETEGKSEEELKAEIKKKME